MCFGVHQNDPRRVVFEYCGKSEFTFFQIMNDFFPVLLGVFENCFTLVKRSGDFESLLGEQNHAKLVGKAGSVSVCIVGSVLLS